MGFVNNDKVTINYRCMGGGRDVVLIHGLAANHAFWHLNVLLPLARKYHLTLYDLRGHGYSGMPPSGYTSADMAEDLRLLLNHLEIPQANLVGHSFGGVVALHFAVLYPERVSSLIIADARIRALQPTQRPRDWPNWSTAKKSLEDYGLLIPEDETEAGLWLLEKLASPKAHKAREKLEGRPVLVPFGNWSGSNRSAQKWLKLLDTTTARQDLTSTAGLELDNLSQIKHPTLAIYGENSPLLPSMRGLRDHLSRCQNVIIPRAGHFYPLTQPKIFAGKVGEFLAELDRKDRRKHKRLPCSLPVDLRKNGHIWFPGETINISSHGLLVESGRDWRIGSEVEARVLLNNHREKIILRGKVLRKERKEIFGNFRFGVKLHIEGDNFQTWESFLAA